MKKLLVFLGVGLSILLFACKPDPVPEPDPTDNNEMPDSTALLGKKYLVGEYHPYEPDTLSAIRLIQWDDDFTRILHITTKKNTPYQIDFDFEYYGVDSFQVHLSKPIDGWALVLFTDYTCHLDSAERISSIDYYFNSVFQSTQIYQYDELGHLVGAVYYTDEGLVGSRFQWDGDNVTAVYSVRTDELVRECNGFHIDAIHPESTMPYLLLSGDFYGNPYLTEPLWRNWFAYDSDFVCECDEDGYVISQYRIDENGEKKAITNYEYATKTNLF
ncbi:MAG: hypothetical protein J5831_01445 [Bacteroidales bacterium]|nr:hypothetical protein [Bacteroidales bacterium]